jgi:hypothetical protein
MLDIIPESERMALFKDETYQGLKGPGVVVLLPLPGVKSLKLRIGDRGRLISSNRARFKELVVPVSLASPTTQTDVAIKDFTESGIIVTGDVESVPAPGNYDEDALARPVKRRLTLPNLVAALLVMLLFAGAGWGGAYSVSSRLSLERAVYRDGILTSGLVLQKTSSSSPGWSTTYYLTYAFDSPKGRMASEAEVDTALWYRSKQGAAIAVRYVPDGPERNLPEGAHPANGYLFPLVSSSAVGLLCTIVIVGIIVNQLRPATQAMPRRPS